MIQRSKVKCSICGREISKSNITKHESSCKGVVATKNYEKHDGLNCQFCGKLFENTNKLYNHERRCSKNPNYQSSGFDKFNAARKAGEVTTWNKGLTAETDERVAQQKTSLNDYYKEHDGYWKDKKHTSETKIKIGAGVKRFLSENPNMVPYKRNHSSKESYPEQYFADIFERENFPLISQCRIGTYKLDFCNKELKIDIEIDGEQHYLDSKIIEHDIKRTNFLESLGWTVYRVRWADFKKLSFEEKQKIIHNIKTLLQM